jgi:hypothetical protein
MAWYHDLNLRALPEVSFNVTAASNVTSPYNANSLVHGIYNRNHTSTIALILFQNSSNALALCPGRVLFVVGYSVLGIF